jgi:Zn-dependent protease
MVDPPRTARDEIEIAIAGPLVSLALAGIGLGLGAATGVPILAWLGWVNLALGLFNLIPALPMDGGRILRASLAGRLGYQRATEVSITVARVFAVLFAVAGLVLGQLQLVLLAALVWFLGSAERRMAAETAYPRPPARVVYYRW